MVSAINEIDPIASAQAEPRAATGCLGLDNILNGGLPKGRIYLIEGDPGLINAHRHSASVEVNFTRNSQVGTLEIRDFGRGLPRAVMEGLQRTGTGSGVGPAGVRECMKELGGDFTIASHSNGTTLCSVVPLSLERDGFQTSAGRLEGKSVNGGKQQRNQAVGSATQSAQVRSSEGMQRSAERLYLHRKHCW